MEIQLNCANPKCDKALLVEVNRKPQFGFELAGLARDVGWVGVIDMGQHISVIYCSEDCLKTGKFTKHLIVLTPTPTEKQEVRNG